MNKDTLDRATRLWHRLAERTTATGRARRFNASRYVRLRFAYHRAGKLLDRMEFAIVAGYRRLP